MAVYRRRICQACRHEVRDGKLLKVLPPCPECGEPMAYTAQWYVEVRVRTPKGLKRVTRAVSTKKEEAQAEERRLLGERDQGAVVRPGTKTDFPSVAKVFRGWLDDQENSGKLAKGSVRAYRYRLSSQVEPFFAKYDIRHIDFDAVDSFVRHRRKDKVRPATINREVATLKRLLSIAVLKKVVPTNPLLGYQLLPEDNCREVHLTGEQVTALLVECAKEQYPRHLLPIVTVALNTGLRKEGCLTLRWEEIDWRRGEITKRVKGGTVVHIPMTPQLKESLDAWRQRDGVVRTHGLCFPSPKTGKAMLVTSKFGFETAVAALGWTDVVFHTTRHSFATLFLEAFPDHMETLRVILGHSSAYMTRRYAHITDKAKRETLGRFEIGG